MSVYYGEFVCPNGHAHKPAQSVVSEPDEAAVEAVDRGVEGPDERTNDEGASDDYPQC